MTFNSVKDLETLVKMCRKEGVTTLKLGELELTLGEKPEKPKPQDSTADRVEMPDQLTEDQLLFFSAGIPTEQN